MIHSFIILSNCLPRYQHFTTVLSFECFPKSHIFYAKSFFSSYYFSSKRYWTNDCSINTYVKINTDGKAKKGIWEPHLVGVFLEWTVVLRVVFVLLLGIKIKRASFFYASFIVYAIITAALEVAVDKAWSHIWPVSAKMSTTVAAAYYV